MGETLNIALVGLGTVGAGVIRLVEENAALIARRAGKPIRICGITARDRSKDRGVDLTPYEWVDDMGEFATRADIDVVVELIGGADGPALTLAKECLSGGKAFVTANKAMVAHHGLDLAQRAETAGLAFKYEAAVAGGIPVIKGLREGAAANRLSRVYGILNGTCNFILSAMEKTGGLFLLLLAVLAFHSLVAKPFYIPTMSMMPNLLVGDRLVVTKYPYGWSWVSVSFHLLPPMKGRIMGKTPEYGDIVIATPPGAQSDYIKRVIGRPGDTIEVRQGRVILNGEEIPRAVQPNLMLPVDINSPCNASDFPMLKARGADGRYYCELPIIRETLPNGVSYNTIDLGPDYPLDNYGPYKVPAGHVFLMGDNRDRSADSRASLEELGLGGAVPLENIGGRAEIVTFSLDGSTNWNPISWWDSLRGDRAGTSLRPDKD